MKLFLKAKHWQLFIFIAVIPILAYILAFGSMMVDMKSAVSAGVQPDLLGMIDNMMPFWVVFVISMLTYYGWVWAVNVGLKRKIPQHAETNLTRFKILFFIPLAYFVLLFIGVILFMPDLMAGVMAGDETVAKTLGIIIVIVIPLYFFSMLCVFYLFFFTAKTLKTIELKREVSFSDFVAELVMVWFLPIGIWFLQPKINQMIDLEDVDEVTPPSVGF